jgi:hypothetical protein
VVVELLVVVVLLLLLLLLNRDVLLPATRSAAHGRSDLPLH